jgi:MSHA biogenesis protein MshJ
MKAKLALLEARINKLAARERVILFVVISLAFGAIADTAFISPVLSAQREVSRKLPLQKVELDKLRAELQAMSATPKNTQDGGSESGQSTESLEDINSKIDRIVSAETNGVGLEEFLVQLLKKQDGLRLVNIQTMGPELNNESSSSHEDGVKDGVSRDGVIFRVAGTYPNLIRYVKTLEGAMPNLRWGQMHLSTDKKTPELSLQVYLVGVAK